MSEGESKTEEEARSAETAAAAATAALANLPDRLDINELQALPADDIEKLCRDFELRVYPGRSRHHLILDLVRAALGLGVRVTTTGFFDPVADAFGILRWPRLNFLSVPEEVGVPRALIQKFKFRPAQKVRGTVRPPRDREKMVMLDEVLEVERIPVEQWTEPTAFDNLTPLY